MENRAEEPAPALELEMVPNMIGSNFNTCLAIGWGHCTVLVVDMVEDMFQEPAVITQRKSLVASINRLLSLARGAGHKVIWCRQEFEPDLSDAPLEYRCKKIFRTIRGTSGIRFLPELNVNELDQVIIKKRYSAFFGTDLSERFEKQGTRTIIVAGVNTHACVRMTAIDAYQRDYAVYIFEECVASYDQVHHDISLRYLDGKICKVLRLRDIEGL